MNWNPKLFEMMLIFPGHLIATKSLNIYSIYSLTQLAALYWITVFFVHINVSTMLVLHNIINMGQICLRINSDISRTI